jgi:flagellar biogenesis protein FliO
VRVVDMKRSSGMQLLQSAEREGNTKTATELNGLAGWAVSLLRGWRVEQKKSQRHMHLVETLPLGGKKQLMLVSCGGERFLVGGGQESVETIVRVSSEVSLSAAVKSLDETCL